MCKCEHGACGFRNGNTCDCKCHLSPSEKEKLRAALWEAVNIVEGRPGRSPFVAVEDWKKLLKGEA